MKTEFCDQGPSQFVVAECSNIHESTWELFVDGRQPQFPAEGGYKVEITIISPPFWRETWFRKSCGLRAQATMAASSRK